MKSDKPFKKFIVCGIILFVLWVVHCLSITGTKNFAHVNYGRICFVSFVPAALAAALLFFSKKKWGWIKFMGATILALICCATILAHYLEMELFDRDWWPVPEIAFKHQLSASWVLDKGRPITDVKGNPTGSQMILKNKDRRRVFWIEAWNSQDDFKSNVEFQKKLMETRAEESGFEIQEKKFLYNPTNKEMATLMLRSQKGDLTNNIVCQFWTRELEHEQIVLASVAEGRNVEMSNDEEVADIISSVTIK